MNWPAFSFRRAYQTLPRCQVGAMITASHNAEPDNGMKLADSHGGMLDAAWEQHAVSLANAPTSKHALILIQTLLDHAKGHHPGKTSDAPLPKMVVHIGRDTRAHSPPLAALVIRAARAMGATVIDHGEVSTYVLRSPPKIFANVSSSFRPHQHPSCHW